MLKLTVKMETIFSNTKLEVTPYDLLFVLDYLCVELNPYRGLTLHFEVNR